MSPLSFRSTAMGISVVALAFAAGLAPAVAQDQRTPAIVLPPQPEVDVRLATGGAPAAGEPAAQAVVPPSAIPAIEAPAELSPALLPPAPAPVQAAAPPPAAPAPAPAPPPALAVAALDQPLRAALEALVREAPRAQPAQKQQREQILAFYAQRQFAPLWLGNSGWTAAARGAQARIGKAAEDGLDVRLRPAADLAGGDEKALVAAELELTQAVVAYGQQASGGRFNPRAIANLITEKPEVAEPAKILGEVAAADGDAALAGFNPPHPGYVALRAKLAELRANRPPEPVRIAAGPTLRVGMKDARLPSLRERFRLAAASDADVYTYDAPVAEAVKEFQRGKGFPANGLLTPATVAALSDGGPAKLESELLANMERWRWTPRSTSADRVEVNIPDYTVRVTRGGSLVHSARVIVGKPNTPTPVFSNRMRFLEVNPYWNVPESIIKNEMMPRMARDPSYLARMGYQVSHDRKGRMIVRQPPGNRNALGFIKFMFPNEHAVYLHDTPTRNLFANARRAYSHGCVRVDQPFKLAEIVLGRDNGWSEERVKKLIGTGNKTINLPQQLDVHIQYFTAFVDDDGQLQLRDDIYGYSRRLKAAMGLQG